MVEIIFTMLPFLGGVLCLILAALLLRGVSIMKRTAKIENPRTRMRVFLEAIAQPIS